MSGTTGATARRIAVALAASAGLIAPAVVLVPAAQAAGSVVSTISINAPTRVVYGTQFSVYGTLSRWKTTTKIPNAKVVLQRATHGQTNWTAISTTLTTSIGAYKFNITPTRAYDYRVAWAGNTTYTAARSAVRYPVVAQKVLLDSIKTIDADYGILRAYGRVYPTPVKGAAIWLQRYSPTLKTWVTIATTSAPGTTGYVGVSAKVAGSIATYRLAVPSKGLYAGNVSTSRTFSHYVWRGVFKKAFATGGTGNPQVTVITDDADRALVQASAAASGSVWVDFSTSGCTGVDTIVANFATETLGAKVLKGTTVLGSSTIAATTPDGSYWQYQGTPGGASTLRVELTDNGTVDSLKAIIGGYVLCTN